MALFSGHDSTIIPVLASLGPRVYDKHTWPAYASMILIEIHAINIDGQMDSTLFESNFGFRLIYNGQVLTPLIDGCPSKSQLCDIHVLMERVKPFALLNRNCALEAELEGSPDSSTPIKGGDFLSSPGGAVAFMLAIVASALLGALITYIISLSGGRASRYSSATVTDHDDNNLIFQQEAGSRKMYSDDAHGVLDKEGNIGESCNAGII
jgi:ubiquitin-like domain-containing CTD phosphatase 1